MSGDPTPDASPGLFTMDALLNKKTSPKTSPDKSSSSQATPSRNDGASRSHSTDDHGVFHKLKLADVGRKVTSATSSIDKFAKSTKDKLQKKLAKGVAEEDPVVPRESDSRLSIEHSNPGGKPVEPGTDVTGVSGNGSYEIPANRGDALDPLAPRQSPSPKAKNRKSLDHSFKVFGERVSQAAKTTGRKMVQLGNEIEHEFAKLGNTMIAKENIEDPKSHVDNEALDTAVHDGVTTAPADPTEEERREHIRRLMSAEGDQFPRMQRRVSDVLEIDKSCMEDDAIYDPVPEEFVSKISNMENLFAHSSSSQSFDPTTLSEPTAHHSLGMTVSISLLCLLLF